MAGHDRTRRHAWALGRCLNSSYQRWTLLQRGIQLDTRRTPRSRARRAACSRRWSACSPATNSCVASRPSTHLERGVQPGARAVGGLGRLLHALGEERVRVLEDGADVAEHADLADALRLTDAGALQRRLAQHRRLRMELLEVLHDRERFGEMAAVVELEDGQASERVLLEELRRAVLSGQDVDGSDGTSIPFSLIGRRELFADWARPRTRTASSSAPPLGSGFTPPYTACQPRQGGAAPISGGAGSRMMISPTIETRRTQPCAGRGCPRDRSRAWSTRPQKKSVAPSAVVAFARPVTCATRTRMANGARFSTRLRCARSARPAQAGNVKSLLAVAESPGGAPRGRASRHQIGQRQDETQHGAQDQHPQVCRHAGRLACVLLRRTWPARVSSPAPVGIGRGGLGGDGPDAAAVVQRAGGRGAARADAARSGGDAERAAGPCGLDQARGPDAGVLVQAARRVQRHRRARRVAAPRRRRRRIGRQSRAGRCPLGAPPGARVLHRDAAHDAVDQGRRGPPAGRQGRAGRRRLHRGGARAARPLPMRPAWRRSRPTTTST